MDDRTRATDQTVDHRAKKKSRGGGGLQHPRMVRLETLFRALLDAPDRGINRVRSPESQDLTCTKCSEHIESESSAQSFVLQTTERVMC